MPDIRVMTWNIEHFAWNKAKVTGMIDAIAATVIGQSIDLLIVVEVHQGSYIKTMNALAARLNQMAPGAGNDYTFWCVSPATGRERYGFIIRDLNTIRPVQVTLGPAGTSDAPITNLFLNTFQTYPGTFAAVADAYAAISNVAPRRGPDLPLAAAWVAEEPRDPQQPREAGEDLVGGGFELGDGFRRPCMALFEVRAATGAPTLLPINVFHLNSERGPAGEQMAQFKCLHIAQHFAGGNYISLNGAPARIQEIVFTGDFNVDFLDALPNGNAQQRADARAYASVTGAAPSGGSAAPAAAPGAAKPVPGSGATGAVAFPFVAPYPNAVAADRIPALGLRIAATTERTKYKSVTTTTPPTDAASMRIHCYDNFIYGGTQLAGGAVRVPCPAGSPAPPFAQPAGDAELTVDPAHNVRLSGDPTIAATRGLITVKGVAIHYARLRKKRADRHPVLIVDYQAPSQAAAAPALGPQERWVAARLLSDHLPVVIQLNLR